MAYLIPFLSKVSGKFTANVQNLSKINEIWWVASQVWIIIPNLRLPSLNGLIFNWIIFSVDQSQLMAFVLTDPWLVPRLTLMLHTGLLGYAHQLIFVKFSGI